jgi:hypothetical protein
MSQFIEQKFKTLTYKELSQMLRLTPLEETISGQELIKNERVDILTRQILLKFAPSTAMMEAIGADLQKLSLENLKLLLERIIKIETFEQLEYWINEHLPGEQA